MKTNRINALKSTIKTVIVAAALTTSAQFVNSQNLNLNLLACYPLDCDNAVDMSGNGRNATISNVNCTAGHTGAGNTAYEFTGNVNSYIQLPLASGVFTPTDVISFSGWVKTTDVTTEQYIVFAWNGCSSYHEGYTMVIGKNLGSGNYGFAICKSDGCSSSANQVLVSSTGASGIISNNQWYHVGMVVTNTALKLYINGVLNNTVSHSKNFLYGTNTQVVLGGSLQSFNEPLSGALDNCRFYHRELSATEFWTLYKLDPSCTDCGLGTYQANLEACYPLDCDAVNYAPTSATPPSLDGTISSATCATGHNGTSNTAYQFSGNASSYISFPNDSRLKPSAITVACWVKIDQLQSVEYIVFCHNGCTSYHEGYTIVGHASGNNVYYEAAKSGDCFGSTQISVNSSAAPSSTNNWQCVVAYFDANGVKLWVDGTGYTQSGGTTLLYGSSPVYLAGTNVAFNYPLNGRIDNVKFWSKELTTDEIQYLCDQDVGCDDWCRNESRPSNATGLNKIQMERGANMTIYPNPANGKFYIKNSDAEYIVISDIAGKQVSFTSTKVDDKTIELNLPEQSQGIYFVKLYDKKGNNFRTQKIVIQK